MDDRNGTAVAGLETKAIPRTIDDATVVTTLMPSVRRMDGTMMGAIEREKAPIRSSVSPALP